MNIQNAKFRKSPIQRKSTWNTNNSIVSQEDLLLENKLNLAITQKIEEEKAKYIKEQEELREKRE